jgi:hypothetical protein
MKLQTSIALRRDGTLKLRGLDGADYVFMADAQGDVVCDVTDEPTIVHLLSQRADFFWPASEADYDDAKRLLGDADLDDELDLPDGADPLAEANTPPAVAPGNGKRVSKAAAKKTPKAAE